MPGRSGMGGGPGGGGMRGGPGGMRGPGGGMGGPPPRPPMGGRWFGGWRRPYYGRGCMPGGCGCLTLALMALGTVFGVIIF